jgi:hypothetical protein
MSKAFGSHPMEHISIEAEVVSRFWKRQILWQWHYGQFDGSEQYSKHQLTNYLKFISLLRFASSITIPFISVVSRNSYKRIEESKKESPRMPLPSRSGGEVLSNERP